jgi:hypothetical protein
MKSILVLIFFFAAITAGHAQQHTRDALFPDFQKDAAKVNKTAPKSKEASVRNTRQHIFTNYQPQTATHANSARKAAVSGGKQLPSDMSAADAAKKTTAPAAAKMTPPSQGQEPDLKAPTPATKTTGPVNNNTLKKQR